MWYYLMNSGLQKIKKKRLCQSQLSCYKYKFSFGYNFFHLKAHPKSCLEPLVVYVYSSVHLRKKKEKKKKENENKINKEKVDEVGLSMVSIVVM